MNLKSSFIINLIDTYYFEKNLNNYNYEIIENLKNIRKIKLTNENFQNFNVLKYQIFKTLNYHKDAINQIKILKDGRISSSANDKAILI